MFGIPVLSKVQMMLLQVAAGVLAATGLFGTGFYFGKEHTDVKYKQSAISDFMTRVDVALKIGDDLAALALNLSKKTQEAKQATSNTIQRGKSHVEQNPGLASSGDIDDYLFQLRSCQIDRVYQAAGHPLPVERHGASCPPSVPDKQESGKDHH